MPVVAKPNHAQLLTSPDPKTAANKRIVYDLWREVLEGGHLYLADRYLAEGYVQHNPGIPTGRKGFVEFIGRFAKPKPIEDSVKAEH